jgi:hypothetical protein
VKLVSFTAAAVIALLTILPAIRRMVDSGRLDRPPAVPPIVARQPDPDLHSVSDAQSDPDDRRGLHLALAEATSATWDLARSASLPAARISLEVLDATTRAEGHASEHQAGLDPAPPEVSVAVPSLFSKGTDPSGAAAVWQQVGDHLAAGVRPLPSTARQAFGFLLGPARDPAGARAKRPTAKGA